MINLPVDISHKLENIFRLPNTSAKLRSYFAEHSSAQKVAVVAAHLFRMTSCALMIAYMPFTPLINFSITLAGNYLYRLAIEPCCSFKFALTSTLGGLTLAPALASINAIVTGAIFDSALAFGGATLGLIPIAAYTFTVISFTNDEVNFLHQDDYTCCDKHVYEQ